MTDSLAACHAPPTVLFVCVSNAGKSVMAQGLMRHAAPGRVNALSAGTHAKTSVNIVSAQALAELDIDISDHTPTQLTAALIDAADLIVVLGTHAQLNPANTPIEVWETDEPSLRGIGGIERMRLIRDDIRARVNDLTDRGTDDCLVQLSLRTSEPVPLAGAARTRLPNAPGAA